MLIPRDLLDYLPAKPVILEAGAHHGEDTVALAQHAAHVYAFEPVPECYVKAWRATAGCTNVTLSRLALGAADMMGWMWISAGRNDASSSLLVPTLHRSYYQHIGFLPEPMPVVVTTIESWAEHNHVKHIDGMWLDMQGTELLALQAAGSILDSVTAIMLEVSLVELYDGAPTWPEVQAWLADQGFKVAVEDLYSEHAGDAIVVRS